MSETPDVEEGPTKVQERINYYLTLIVLGLFIILPPILCGLVYLSFVPDISWGDETSPSYTRVWMHREKRPVGIGYETRRVIQELDDTEVCVRTTLRFLLWQSSDIVENADRTQKMVQVNERWQPTGEACEN